LTDRKKPVKHEVKSHTKNNKTVRSYSRGSGQSKSKSTPQIMGSKKPKNRWTQLDSLHWRSNENKDITVEVNLELLDEEDDEGGETIERETYLVFPSHNGSGIPNSPEIFNEGSSGSISEAKKDAVELAKKIMKLPIEKIERFDWDMV
jgi:hypothetical protein